jgi:hypothetical protein
MPAMCKLATAAACNTFAHTRKGREGSSREACSSGRVSSEPSRNLVASSLQWAMAACAHVVQEALTLCVLGSAHPSADIPVLHAVDMTCQSVLVTHHIKQTPPPGVWVFYQRPDVGMHSLASAPHLVGGNLAGGALDDEVAQLGYQRQVLPSQRWALHSVARPCLMFNLCRPSLCAPNELQRSQTLGVRLAYTRCPPLIEQRWSDVCSSAVANS